MVSKKKSATVPKKKKDSKPLTEPTFRRGVVRSVRLIRNNKKPFFVITFIYGTLYFLFIRVLSTVNVASLDETIKIVFGGGEGSIITRTLTAASLFGAGASFDQTTGVYFAIIWFINSLAIIWVLRYIWAGKRVSVKEAYYQGMYPLVPMILITLLMFIQAIPFSIALFLFQTAINNGLAINLIERIGVLSILVVGILISGYWIMGSLVALYSSTVPGMTPRKAVKTAKEVLEGRRFATLKQVLYFLIFTSLTIISILLLVIWIKQDAAVVVTALLTIGLLPWVHTFFYGIYRDLLDE